MSGRGGAAGARSGPVTRTALIRGARDLQTNTKGPEIKKCKVMSTVCGQNVASHGLAVSPGVSVCLIGKSVRLTEIVISSVHRK